MKESIFILGEYHHPPAIKAVDLLICQTVTAWLTKELHK